jgi:LysM domain
VRTLDPKTYTVRPGDTLTLIATKSGLLSWKDIYYSPANAAFRVRRPDPNRIQPGDRILIPPTSVAVREVLQARLANLMALRGQTDGLYAQIERNMDDNIRKYDQVSRNADAAATVANLLAGLGTLVFKGIAAMKLSGSALTAANKELTKQTGELIIDPLKDPALKLAADKIGANPGIVWAVGQITIESWLNMNSPSWWAGVVGNLQDGKSWSQAVTNDPREALKATRNAIESQRQNTLKKIDDRIRATQVLLVGVSSRGLVSLYDKGRHAVA